MCHLWYFCLRVSLLSSTFCCYLLFSRLWFFVFFLLFFNWIHSPHSLLYSFPLPPVSCLYVFCSHVFVVWIVVLVLSWLYYLLFICSFLSLCYYCFVMFLIGCGDLLIFFFCLYYFNYLFVPYVYFLCLYTITTRHFLTSPPLSALFPLLRFHSLVF